MEWYWTGRVWTLTSDRLTLERLCPLVQGLAAARRLGGERHLAGRRGTMTSSRCSYETEEHRDPWKETDLFSLSRCSPGFAASNPAPQRNKRPIHLESVMLMAG